SSNDIGLVISKTREEDVGWVTNFCRDFKCAPYIYTMDEPGFLIPRTNVGHEASAYLTHIIDHYYDLHPYTIFIYDKEENWYNDVDGLKTLNQLPSLRFEAVNRKGFVNLRCLAIPGCLDGLHPSIIQQTDIDNKYLTDNFPQIWPEIFGLDLGTAPLQLGHHCCEQFAVTKQRIRQRRWSDYDRMIQWIARARWSDSYGVGWLMEKLWHVIFGMPPVEYVSLISTLIKKAMEF
ncbi:hypothetical protein N7447_000368, partial [Penicillium robsamsonii]|uniref:uncharacterized protein n=1 Tax=Penicillium robsamsonii TaxID=1792511 RepID=UPI0025466FF2